MIRFPTTSHEWHMQNMEEMRRGECALRYPNDLATGYAGPLRLQRPPEATGPKNFTTKNPASEKRKS